MTFSVGDRVGLVEGRKVKYNPDMDDGPIYGEITHIVSENSVMVKWDDKWMRESPKYKLVSPDKLMTEVEVKTKYSELERVFRKLECDVQAKLKEAGQLILDAQKIAKTSGFNLQELYEATAPLEDAMEEAGWQTSSWHC